MPEPVGGDPDSLLRLAGAIDGAAAELRRLQVRAAWGAGATGVPSGAAALAARVQVWLASEAPDLRRRARILAEDRRYLVHPSQRFGMASQRGVKRLRLTDEEAQVERLNAVVNDPAATEAAKDAAKEQLKALAKETGDRHSRQSNDVKPPPKSPKATRKAQAAKKAAAAKEAAEREAVAAGTPLERALAAEKEATEKKAVVVTTLAAVGTGLWWAGKALSPACGPAAPLCALAL